MKLVLTSAVAAVLIAGAATATVDYTAVCNSSKLLASDRHECRVQMTAATANDARQAEIHRFYAAKIDRLLNARGNVAPMPGASTIPSDG